LDSPSPAIATGVLSCPGPSPCVPQASTNSMGEGDGGAAVWAGLEQAARCTTKQVINRSGWLTGEMLAENGGELDVMGFAATTTSRRGSSRFESFTL
jgi:hypothetical protein